MCQLREKKIIWNDQTKFIQMHHYCRCWWTARVQGDQNNPIVVRYDPALTKARHENDELRLDLDRRRAAERELRKRLDRAERRIQEGEKMTNKLDVSRRANQKLERQLKSLKKYLSELPTRDKYKKLQV